MGLFSRDSGPAPVAPPPPPPPPLPPAANPQTIANAGAQVAGANAKARAAKAAISNNGDLTKDNLATGAGPTAKAQALGASA